jgi:hypothetical protein
MERLSGIVDTDREILLKLSDKDLLKSCGINKYFRNKVCNEQFYITRLTNTYPDTLKYKNENISWREYFLKTIYYISKMKEKFGIEYINGNPYINYLVKIVLENKIINEYVREDIIHDIQTETRHHSALLRVNRFMRNVEILKYFLNLGIKPDIQDLHQSINNQNFESLKLLFPYIVINQNELNEMANIAAYGVRLDILEYLIAKGAIITEKTLYYANLGMKQKDIIHYIKKTFLKKYKKQKNFHSLE